MTIADDIERRSLADRDLRYPTLYGRARGALILLANKVHVDTPEVYAASVLAMLDEMEQIAYGADEPEPELPFDPTGIDCWERYENAADN